jgi:hypothetical protein
LTFRIFFLLSDFVTCESISYMLSQLSSMLLTEAPLSELVLNLPALVRVLDF